MIHLEPNALIQEPGWCREFSFNAKNSLHISWDKRSGLVLSLNTRGVKSCLCLRRIPKATVNVTCLHSEKATDVSQTLIASILRKRHRSKETFRVRGTGV